MIDGTRRGRARESDHPRELERDLAELCRRHGVGLDLIQDSRDIDDLIERVVGNYEKRSAKSPGDAVGAENEPAERARYDLRSLVAFACRASVLRERATASAEPQSENRGGVLSPGDAAARIERLEDLLSTVGALIHKINNPLTALVGRAQLLRMQGELPPRVLHGAEVIEESSRRIAELTRELASRVKEGRRLASGRAETTDDFSTSPSEPVP